ncbi:hypothetical protein [Shimia sp. MMG029]|uniref:hypothetical protein n=1 Tax=Shimia sp. MMG029 TaxID=3021978 RepID=UPI0022FE8FD4|nr:hypothetical protein [Shimia sp. MMG029]MDA5558692.1 hypothetical protein [Shimia sp. MMG029]
MTEECTPPESQKAIQSFAAVLDVFGLIKANVSSAIALSDMLIARRQVADLKATMRGFAMLRSTQYKTLTPDHIERLRERSPDELREIIESDFKYLKVATDSANKNFGSVAGFLNYSNPRLVADVEHALQQRINLLDQTLQSHDPAHHLSPSKVVEIYEQYSKLAAELMELLEALSKEISKREGQ